MATGSAGGPLATLRKFVHLIACAHFYYGLYYDMRYVYPPEGHPLFHIISTFGGKFRYLTILGAVGINSIFPIIVEKSWLFIN